MIMSSASAKLNSSYNKNAFVVKLPRHAILELLNNTQTEHRNDRRRFDSERTAWSKQKANLKQQLLEYVQQIAALTERNTLLDKELQKLRSEMHDHEHLYLKAVRLNESLRTNLETAELRLKQLEEELAQGTRVTGRLSEDFE